MTIGDRIKEIRGNVSRDDFAAMFGVNRATVQRYEIYERGPSIEFVAAICEKYNINANWLIFGQGPKFKGEAKEEPANSEEFNYIPMIEAKLSAGGGAFVNSENIEGYYAFRKKWIKRVASSPKNLVLLQIVGDSMSPTIQERDTVMIDTSRKDIKEGTVYAIRFGNTIMIKRLAFRPNDKILVISDNKKDYEPYEVATSDLYIIGQVIFFSRVLVPE
jgi:phage repressor protein C with HTH and peptisase S24 domain